MSNIVSVLPRHRRRRRPLAGHFGMVAVVVIHLFDDIADERYSQEDCYGDDDNQQALAGRRQAVERVLCLQIMELDCRR